MIKRKTIDEIFAASRVDEVIEDYVNLKRRGVNLIGLCPFHNEKTPSFTVSPTKNLYKCLWMWQRREFGQFPDGARKILHIRKRSNTWQVSIILRLRRRERTDEAIEEQKKRDSLILINEMAVEYFNNQLLETEEGKSIGLSYLKHRGLNERTINTFHLGYSPPEFHSFYFLCDGKRIQQRFTDSVGFDLRKRL